MTTPSTNQAAVEYDTSVLTPTQRNLMNKLSSGEGYTRKQLMECLPDGEFTDPNMVTSHISKLRKVLVLQGYEIICEVANHRFYYRMVRSLNRRGE